MRIHMSNVSFAAGNHLINHLSYFLCSLEPENIYLRMFAANEKVFKLFF